MRFSRLADLSARLSGWPRRIIALIFLLLAAGAALTDRAAAPAAVRVPTTPVVVSSTDLAVGTVLRPDQLRVVSWPAELRPAGAFARTSDLVGQRLAGPTRSGEAVTRTRLAGPDLASGLPSGFIATPAPVIAGSTTFVHAGNQADLIAPAGDSATATCRRTSSPSRCWFWPYSHPTTSGIRRRPQPSSSPLERTWRRE